MCVRAYEDINESMCKTVSFCVCVSERARARERASERECVCVVCNLVDSSACFFVIYQSGRFSDGGACLSGNGRLLASGSVISQSHILGPHRGGGSSTALPAPRECSDIRLRAHFILEIARLMSQLQHTDNPGTTQGCK